MKQHSDKLIEAYEIIKPVASKCGVTEKEIARLLNELNYQVTNKGVKVMAQRSLRPCKRRGCKNLTRDRTGYCSEHIHIYEERRSKRNKYYDKNIRYSKDKQYTKFYHSKEWEKLREYILILYKGIDIYNYYIENKIVASNTVHHINEIKDDWDKRLDIDNLFPLSEVTHNKIHVLYKKDKKGTQKLLRELLKRFRKQFGISPLS